MSTSHIKKLTWILGYSELYKLISIEMHTWVSLLDWFVGEDSATTRRLLSTVYDRGQCYHMKADCIWPFPFPEVDHNVQLYNHPMGVFKTPEHKCGFHNVDSEGWRTIFVQWGSESEKWTTLYKCLSVKWSVSYDFCQSFFVLWLIKLDEYEDVTTVENTVYYCQSLHSAKVFVLHIYMTHNKNTHLTPPPKK